MSTKISRRKALSFLGLALVIGKIEIAYGDDKAERRKRWDNLSPEEKERLRLSYRRFKALPLARQERIRMNFKRWRSLSPERREIIKRKIHAWRQLSPQKRQLLRQRARRLRRQRFRQ